VIARVFVLVLVAAACGGRSGDEAEGSGSSAVQVAAAYDKQCVAGDQEGCRNLGVLYSEGIGVAKDPRKAAALFAQACTGGSMAACNHMGLLFAEGMGVDKSPLEAGKMFAKACDGGHGLACKNLGLMLRDGRGIDKNVELAEKALDKACVANTPFACTNAGDLDRQNAEATKDDQAKKIAWGKMREHYQKGCEAKDMTSCRQLGVAYLDGAGVPKTPTAASVWLLRACPATPSPADDAVACRLLGMMKVDGFGVPQDRDAGMRELSRACDKKDVKACEGLALVKQQSGSGSVVKQDAGVTSGSGSNTRP
jgi:TPR repeat protein